MSFWSRMKRAGRRVAERIAHPLAGGLGHPETAPEPRESPPVYYPTPDYGDRDYGGGGDGGSLLPEGWALVGLYHHGEKTTRIFATDDTEVTDADIAAADGIIVHYVNDPDGYRIIHRANGWDSVASLITRTTARVSPPRKR